MESGGFTLFGTLSSVRGGNAQTIRQTTPPPQVRIVMVAQNALGPIAPLRVAALALGLGLLPLAGLVRAEHGAASPDRRRVPRFEFRHDSESEFLPLK